MTSQLFIATPCYGGTLYAQYVSSLLGLHTGLTLANGKPPIVHMLANESLIPRGRNDCVAAFMKTDATHLFFIDADIGFDPADVAAMVNSGLDVVAGVAPRRHAAGAFVLSLHDEHIRDGRIPTLEIAGRRYLLVKDAGTGFMCIRRGVIERMTRELCGRAYVSDDLDPTTRETRYDLFRAGVDATNDPPRYLSEDYAFCRDWQRLGGSVHVLADASLSHSGSHTFTGSFLEWLERAMRGAGAA